MKDKLLHLLCADDMVQVCAISARELVSEARRIHSLSMVATAALGRQLMMTSMMGSRLKNESDRVSTILKGNDGYAGSMVCTAFPDAAVKGCTGDAETELPPTAEGKLDVAGYVGHTGKLTVVRDAGHGDPYVGVCNLISGEIAMDFAEYYAASEQQPSLVYLGVRVDVENGAVRSAGGMLIQPMPGCPDEVIADLTERSGRVSELSRMLDDGMTLDDAVSEILSGLSPHVTDTYEPVYRCDCSRKRIESALLSVGRDEIEDMIKKDGGAEVSCHFCNRTYRFTGEELRTLLNAAADKSSDD
ncbi:MAG: Hsp33 family molecular chaperone HslO [Clostridiales bacterium]|nr:Hsp33 family molecular chaperone HslO [Clostridiales bacterium]